MGIFRAFPRIRQISNNLLVNRFTVSLNREKLFNYSAEGQTFSEGDEITVSKTITEEAVYDFSILSGDTNPVHSRDNQGLAIVHGAFLNSIVSSVIGTKLPGSGALVVQQTLNFPNKCFVGETVDVTVRLVENRKILKIDFSCDVKEKNKTVLYGSAKVVMSK